MEQWTLLVVIYFYRFSKMYIKQIKNSERGGFYIFSRKTWLKVREFSNPRGVMKVINRYKYV